jgi:hypothetical protein
MGAYKHYSGMIVLHVTEGLTADGAMLRVERVQRPMGSTLGIVFVRTLLNGEGSTTEQFSHWRVSLADRAFKAAAAKIIGTTPEQVAAVAKPIRSSPGAERVLLDEAGVTVVMIIGREPRFEIRAPGREVEIIPATRSWKAEQKLAVERAQALIA